MVKTTVSPEVVRLSGMGPAIPSLGWLPAPRYSLRRARILSLAGQGGGRLLDIGCGPGAILFELEEKGWQTQGLEISEAAHDVAKILHHERKTTLHTTPQQDWDASFDRVLALEVLEHIEDDLAAVSDWKKWLKDDGIAIVSVPAHPLLWNESDVQVGHYRRYKRKQLVDLFQTAGFQVDHVEYYGFPLATLIEIIRFGPLTVFLKRLFNRNQKMTAETSSSKLKTSRSKASGTDRSTLIKYWPIVASRPYQYFMRFCGLLQRLPLLQAFGNGLIIVVRKPPTG